MFVVLNYLPFKFPFLIIEKMCTVLNNLKCVVMNDKCEIFKGFPAIVTVSR